MSTCGASLSPKVLDDLERRFDRGGTGEVGVEVRHVDYDDGISGSGHINNWPSRHRAKEEAIVGCTTALN